MPSAPPNPVPSAGPLARWLRNPAGTEERVLRHLAHALTSIAHTLLPLGIALGIALALYSLLAEGVRMRWARRGRFIAIAPPAEPDPAGGLAVWRMLHPLLTAGHSLFGRRPPVAFECHADASGLRLGLWVSPTVSAAAVANAVESAWRGARATVTAPPRPPANARVLGGKVRTAAQEWFPLADEHSARDANRGVLSALICVDPAETAMVQVLARPAAGRRVARARRAARAIRRGQPTTAVGQALDLIHHRSVTGQSSAYADPLALADVREVTAKVTASPHFELAIRYAVSGPPGRDARRRRRARSRQIAAGFGLYTGRNHLIGHHLLRPRQVLGRRRLRRGFLASAAELAALATLPAEPAGYGLPAAPARTVAPPPEVAHA